MLSITKIMQRCDEYKKQLEPSVERQRRLKTEVLLQKSIPVPLFPPQVPHKLA
jgi:hypothetical protein